MAFGGNRFHGTTFVAMFYPDSKTANLERKNLPWFDMSENQSTGVGIFGLLLSQGARAEVTCINQRPTHSANSPPTSPNARALRVVSATTDEVSLTLMNSWIWD